jgi:hypothetical protein
VLSGGGKVISVRGGAVDAVICHSFISDKSISTPFRFLIDTLAAVGVLVDKVSIEISDEGTLARIFMKASGKKKPLCITTSNICSAINVATASGRKISMTSSSFSSVNDMSGQYAIVASELESLWPLQNISKTEILQAMTEIIDASIGSHASK